MEPLDNSPRCRCGHWLGDHVTQPRRMPCGVRGCTCRNYWYWEGPTPADRLVTVARVAWAVATLIVLAVVVLALGAVFVWWTLYVAAPRTQQAIFSLGFVLVLVIVFTVLSEVGKGARIRRQIAEEWEARQRAARDKSEKEET